MIYSLSTDTMHARACVVAVYEIDDMKNKNNIEMSKLALSLMIMEVNM